MRYICSMAADCGREECFARKVHDPVMVDGEPINAAIECRYDRPPLVNVDLGIIEAAFETYEKKVIPVDAGPVQRAESKQAFFGGASIILSVLADVIYSDREPKTAGEAFGRLVSVLSLMSAETAIFADSVVKRGHDGSDKNSV